jgi:hypothetical protein
MMPTTPPPGFVDHWPSRGPWINPIDALPETLSWDNQLLLANGQTTFGLVLETGQWFAGRDAAPILGWRKCADLGLSPLNAQLPAA